MEKKKKRLLTLLTVSSIPAIYFGSGIFAFNKLFKTNRDYENLDTLDMLPTENIKDKYNEYIIDDINWFKTSQVIKVSATSFDGLRLDGVKVVSHEDNKYIIMVHDINADRYSLLRQAKIFADKGFNLLMIDQRGYGHSEGQYTTYGFKESLDLVSWMKMLIEEDPNITIGMYGVSMGASTIMKALSYKLYDNIKFVIADSGYASLRGYLESKLQTNIINSSIALKVKRELGFDIEEVNCIEALKNNEIPLLIIHSKDDKIIKSKIAENLFEANKGYKKLCLIDAKEHAYGCYYDQFGEAINEFLKDIQL